VAWWRASQSSRRWWAAAASTWIVGPGRARDEVNRCQDYLGQLLGRDPAWFRAPAGLANPWLHAAVEDRGLTTLAWTARGFDAGLGRDPATVVRRIRSRWQPGGIILMHQGTTDTKGKPLAPRILERLLEAAGEDGYSWATPRDQLSDPSYQTDP
jgi:peptidoglycan/xylan/chitin deacetylase (PgdA/CDA1 family)